MKDLQRPRPGKWQLFRIWASIGLQSFGGGASTTFLIQRAFIEKYGWITDEEFTHLWGLCVLTPGINLVGLTILIGRKLGGAPGMLISLAGLLLPSSIITCVLTAFFVQIEHIRAAQAVMRGVIPATAGVMLLVGLHFALPLLQKSWKEGAFPLLTNSFLIVSCALAVIFLRLSPIVVVLAGILIGALFFSPRTPASPLPVEGESQE